MENTSCQRAVSEHCGNLQIITCRKNVKINHAIDSHFPSHNFHVTLTYSPVFPSLAGASFIPVLAARNGQIHELSTLFL